MPASDFGGGAAEDLWGAPLEGSSSTPPATGQHQLISLFTGKPEEMAS
jgi:hypothetical protein